MAGNEGSELKNVINKGIKKGTTILTAKPFAFILSEQYRTVRCDQCFKRVQILRCSGCQYVHYCGRNCQRKAWQIHKIECPNLKRIYPRILPDAPRIVARIVIKLSQGGKDEKGYYAPNKYRVFQDLMSHVTNIKADLKKIEHFTSLTMVLLQFLPKELMPDVRELLAIFGRMSVNCFNILDTEMISLGVGVYLEPSIIDHSCNPNAVAIFEGTTILIRTLCDIDSLDWSKIRISYIELLKDTEKRRAELQKSYYFLCDCERCTTPETVEIGAACQNKNCTYPCLSTDTSCAKCGTTFPENFKDSFDEVTELSIYNLEKMVDIAYLDVAKMCLAKQEGVLHPNNLLVVQMLEMALSASMNLERWGDAEFYACQVTERYVFYLGETHPMTGQAYLMQAKLMALHQKKKLAFEYISKAVQLLSISFGENHSKMRKEVKPLFDLMRADLDIV